MQSPKYAHGGDIFGIARKLGVEPSEIVDLSSNISYQAPEFIRTSLQQHWDAVHHLPEPYSQSLLQRLSEQYYFPSSHFICGAGTTELLQWLGYCYASKNVLIVQPTYSDYERCTSCYGCTINYLILEESNEFGFNIEAFCQLAAAVQVVFLCNPNNPTGILLEKDVITDLVERFPDTLFVVDESYMPFVETQVSFSLVGMAFPNLVVLRSMSKIFAVSGLRIGWLFSSNLVLNEKIRSLMSPWSVNSLAQLIAEKLICADASDLVHYIQKIKAKFIEQLLVMQEFRPFPGQANFVLIKSSKYTAHEMYDTFAQQKMLIRDCSNFVGLNQSFIRISVKEEHSMRMAASVFKQLESKGG
ncbi:MAG: aminotransferase class I/II-fold pyridoxal phosphate-dependent enzyme [SAR324 cluster bacterium]|nr:aminotransferase class I/II-fold pyridoxal phosphate-dependent enzyme [SAR324 cluster bacterium]